MRQSKLEEKVEEIFERQGFEVKSEKDNWRAEKDSEKLEIGIYSSTSYSTEELVDLVSEGEKVFVDEGLERVEELVDNQVSIIRESEEVEYNLPSYELIGEIAVINELTVEEEEAVEGILHHHPSVKTILLKEEPLQGEYRVGEYKKLYGGETETVHKEFGCEFKVDPTKVYYSERFSTERKRVVDQIEDGEKVLVMFAGVGPFAIMAAKHANPEKVVAVEKNPAAANYMKENIRLNDVAHKVEGFEGDVEEILPKLDKEFDRVIMPLPESSKNYLDLAKSVLSSEGVIHLYSFEDSNEINLDQNLNLEVLDVTECGERNPKEKRVCIRLEQ